MTTATTDPTFPASTHYVFLEDGGAAAGLELNDAFYQGLRGGPPASPGMERFMSGNGWLMTTTDLEPDVSRWETHTTGDELLILISGAIDLVTEDANGHERIVELRPGRAFIVPKGTWHRFTTREPSRFVGVAYGQSGRGTIYRTIATGTASEPAAVRQAAEGRRP